MFQISTPILSDPESRKGKLIMGAGNIIDEFIPNLCYGVYIGSVGRKKVKRIFLIMTCLVTLLLSACGKKDDYDEIYRQAVMEGEGDGTLFSLICLENAFGKEEV